LLGRLVLKFSGRVVRHNNIKEWNDPELDKNSQISRMHQNMYSEDEKEAFYFQQKSSSYSNSTSGQCSVQISDLRQNIQDMSEQFKLMLDSQKQKIKIQQQNLRTMQQEFASNRRFILHKLGKTSESTYQQNEMKRWGHSSCTNTNLLNIQASFFQNFSVKLPKPNSQIVQDKISTTISRVSSPSIVQEDFLFKTNEVIIVIQPKQQVIERHLGHSLYFATIQSINGEVKKALLSTSSFESPENLLFQKVKQFEHPSETCTLEKLQSINDEFMIVLIPLQFPKDIQKWYQHHSAFLPFTNFDGFKTRRRKEFIEVFRNAFHFKLDLNKSNNQASSLSSVNSILYINCESANQLLKLHSLNQFQQSDVDVKDLVIYSIRD
jgi:hypothetical protein